VGEDLENACSRRVRAAAEVEAENPAEGHATGAVDEVEGSGRIERARDLEETRAGVGEVEREPRPDRDRAGAIARYKRAKHCECLAVARERPSTGEAAGAGQGVGS